MASWRDKVTSEFMRKLGFPVLGDDISLDKIPDDMGYKVDVLRYLSGLKEMLQKGHGLYLCGPYSSGKTTLAYLIAHEARTKFLNLKTAFIRASEVAKFMINDDLMFNSEETWNYRMEMAHLLVLDDLHIRNRKRDDYVEELLRVREQERRSTIITSNVAPADIPLESVRAILGRCMIPVRVEGIDWAEKIKPELPELP